MLRTGLHPGLEMRADLLAERIVDLRRQVKQETGRKRIEDRMELEELERRRKALEERLSALNLEGDTILADLKSAMAQVSFDTACSFDGFFKRLDANYRAANASKTDTRH